MAEDTLKGTPENEALIQEMLRNAKTIEVPSDLITNPVVHKGDAELAAPMIVKEISSAGYIRVWDSRTYEKIPVLYYMLPQILRRRRPDGSYQYTTIDPGQLPKRGTTFCMLHPRSPNRQHYDDLGMRVCNKENIVNPYQLSQHMKKKHPQEWATIENEKKEKEREEDRALQRALLAAQVERLETTPKPEIKARFICNICKADFGSQITLNKHNSTHN